MLWTPQQDAEGCGVAVLAMLTDEPYIDIRAEIDSQDGHGHNGDWSKSGVTHITLDRFLYSRGFYLQRIYEHFDLTGEWPPAPWAPTHFASVQQPSGRSHFVVMDAEGRVLDPLRQDSYRLSDWEKVNNVVGLVRP